MSGQIVSEGQSIVINTGSTTENSNGRTQVDLIERLFKIGLIIAVLAGLLITGLVLFLAFNIWEAVAGTFETATGFLGLAFESFIRATPLRGFAPLFGALTAISTAFFPTRR